MLNSQKKVFLRLGLLKHFSKKSICKQFLSIYAQRIDLMVGRNPVNNLGNKHHSNLKYYFNR